MTGAATPYSLTMPAGVERGTTVAIISIPTKDFTDTAREIAPRSGTNWKCAQSTNAATNGTDAGRQKNIMAVTIMGEDMATTAVENTATIMAGIMAGGERNFVQLHRHLQAGSAQSS